MRENKFEKITCSVNGWRRFPHSNSATIKLIASVVAEKKMFFDRHINRLSVKYKLVMYGSTSTTFNMSNGVKQGSVISPLFFTLYVDELIQTLEKSGYGCKLGDKYYSIFVYADNIFLLSPTFYRLQKMLNICNMFAEDKGLHFNAKKTKCKAFHKKPMSN